MKLIYAIVNNDDAHSVSSSLTKSGFSGHQVCLDRRIFNVRKHDIFICSEDDKIDEIIEIIKDHSHKRKKFVPFCRIIRRRSSTSFPVEVLSAVRLSS